MPVVTAVHKVRSPDGSHEHIEELCIPRTPPPSHSEVNEIHFTRDQVIATLEVGERWLTEGPDGSRAVIRKIDKCPSCDVAPYITTAPDHTQSSNLESLKPCVSRGEVTMPEDQPLAGRWPSILERVDFPVFMLRIDLDMNPARVMGGLSGNGNANVNFNHFLGEGRRVTVHSSNGEIPGEMYFAHRYRKNPASQRAIAALGLHMEESGALPATVEVCRVDLNVDGEPVEFQGARCGPAWDVTGEVRGIKVRVEAVGVEPVDVQLIEVPEALRTPRKQA